MYRHIASLRPEFQPIATKILERVKAETQVNMRITETFRTIARQAEVKIEKASNVSFGWHNVGLAFDFACFDAAGHVIDDGKHPAYASVGAIAIELGCKWPIHLANGNIDAGHIEYHPGFTLQQYLANVTQGSVKAWTPPPEEGQ